MNITGLNHINIRVEPSILPLVQSFYEQVLGLRPGYRPNFNSTGCWLYAHDPLEDKNHAVIHLSQKKNTTPPLDKQISSSNSSGQHAQPSSIDHFAFTCSDPLTTIDKLNALGVPFQRANFPKEHMLQLFFHDPVGNKIELNFSNCPDTVFN